jgi:hypothetical protein
MKEIPKNNCYECPFRLEVPESKHIACAQGFPIKARFLRAYKEGNVPLVFTNKETGDVLLKFDANAIKDGQCRWPVEFDPMDVECYLPIEKKINNGNTKE